jgi:hypothetical protein
MTDTRPAHDGLDQFIPVSKSDLLSALAEQGAFAGQDERDKFLKTLRDAGVDLSLRLLQDARAPA